MPVIRKIEYFEDQLNTSAAGRAVLALVRRHAEEVLYLVNKNRPTLVCWQRHHGPRFIKSVVDSGFEADSFFVKEVEGVKMETLLLYLAEVLQDNGSPELKRDIGRYAPLVLQMAREASSLGEVIYRIHHTQNIASHA
jgi:hypothetical protein